MREDAIRLLPRAIGMAVTVALAAVLSASCAPSIDLQKSIHVTNVASGWYNTGVVNGKHKLVPSISFTLKNQATAPVVSLQVNAVFRRVGETEEWGTTFEQVSGSSGLAPGATSEELTLRSPLGYTGTEVPAQMLENHLFVDAHVTIFGKYGSSQWIKLGDFPIKRVLLNPKAGA